MQQLLPFPVRLESVTSSASFCQTTMSSNAQVVQQLNARISVSGLGGSAKFVNKIIDTIIFHMGTIGPDCSGEFGCA